MIPSPAFVKAASVHHKDQKCKFTKVSNADSVEDVWNLLKTTDGRDDPYSKIIATLLFYSQVFRFRLLEGNDGPITESEYRDAISEWSSLEKPTGEQNYCICGHEVSNHLMVKNSVNSNVLKMGYSCAEKFLSGIIIEAVRIIKLNNSYHGTYRICGCCYLHKIPNTEEWRQICPDCYSLGNREVTSAFTVAFYYKPCKHCAKLLIPGYYPDFKDMCYDCFLIHKPNYQPVAKPQTQVIVKSQGKLKCEQCGLPRIPADKPQFKVCYTCKFGNK